jgi:phosphoserine phosphatase RsbU/P
LRRTSIPYSVSTRCPRQRTHEGDPQSRLGGAACHPDRTIETDFNLTEAVNCDGPRIGQLFSNLLGNAITHGSSNKSIAVRAVTHGGTFEMSVINSGDPITPAAMKQLFQPFYRGTVKQSPQGLGLGLYIASEIARAHGGTLDVSSSQDETQFTFRMPTTVVPL